MNKFLAVLTFLCVPVLPVDADVLEKYAEKLDAFHGRYTRDVKEPYFLVPRRVFEDGSFASYSLPSYYSTDRSKRSPASDKLHLVLPFNGQDHHVELTPYHDFISPDMVVETRGAGIATNINEALRFKRADERQCHYRGIVRGHEKSRAALSLCDGVVGYVQTNHGRYFLEPVHDAEPETDGQHVHMAYKRSAPHEKDRDGARRHCGTTDNWESAWAEQLAKRQKRLLESASKRAPPVSYATHSIHRYIEIGLVADRRFLDYHNNTNYEQYLLTVMNMVSDYYHDSSAGNQFDVVVVKMVYLEKEKEEIDLQISAMAEGTLESFAAWADKMNPKDHEHPNHFDIGVLVTRYDICSDVVDCDLMGLAYVAAACDPPKAACINEDAGLVLGVVIAHEVGHVMGCSHDEEEISGCPSRDKDNSFFLMSPTVFLHTVRWSTCSRKFFNALLESGLGECLNDVPKNPSGKYKYPNMLPGAMYDANFQCELQFPGSKSCNSKSRNACYTLWCHTNATCYSTGTPMADGTKCGENKWCIHRQCVDIGTRPAAINGGWGQWGPAGTCSRTCGGGVRFAERECDNPKPANSGRYCIGERKRISICNTTPCDPTKPSYRTLQCAEYNNQEILTDGLHNWTVYTDPEKPPCALYCINEQRNYMKIRAEVNDSTPCKAGTNYMCVAGTCRKVGCDWIMDSDAIEDKCGVCNGDSTKCSPVEGFFKKTRTGPDAYVKIVTIPKGARSIRAYEEKGDKNTLAVRLEKEKTYCLNGGLQEQRSGDYPCADSILMYMHPEPEKEEIEIKGPLSEDIRLEYVFYNAQNCPGIRYKYYVMSSNVSHTPKYIWDFTEWTECDAKCGGGTMISEASCLEEKGGKVSPNFCEGIPRPEPKSRICNTQTCPAKWRVSQWSKCSACDGKQGTRHRKVQCVRPAARPGDDDVQANLDACKGRVPKQKEDCVGTRPCKTSCPKPSRSTSLKTSNPEPPAMLDERIIGFINQGLAHYLQSLPKSPEKKKRTCGFTTPKPGSIIKDFVPADKIVLIQAPYMDDDLQSNLSDKAFREVGDRVGVGIDTSQQKVFRGQQALNMMNALAHKNESSSIQTNKTYDQLSRVVDE